MSRSIYLVIYHSSPFPAHWSLWIPHIDDTRVGKRIHAIGDAAAGFEIAFERNYNISTDDRSPQVVPLAQVSDHLVVDVRGDGNASVDQNAHDYLEETALSIPAPRKSLVSASVEGPRKRVHIQNCQTWLREVIVAFVNNKAMSADVLQTIDSAAKN
ncbi:hypothetical protein BKA66DRAFT_541213 [Pyrenochaeta sp. MPI-SDFR-AT-0127]|nr:hypothetical protein BKA66DRAFT_541213 [Pyrenochaeta sp. MPI-SDFR-AT-0127]